MNAKRVNAVAALTVRSMENGRKTPAGWAADLESAQLLQSPETAAELEKLRLQVAELLAERHVTNEALSDAAVQLRENRERFETLRALCDAADQVGIVSGGWFTVNAVRRATAGESLPKPRPDGITRRIAPTQALQPSEGEFFGFLHHAHTTPHDLPELGGA